MRSKPQDQDVFDMQGRQIEELALKILQQQKQAMIPTVPLYDHQAFPVWSTDNIPVADPSTAVYDKSKYPNRATEGQIVRDLRARGALWTHGDDNKWHPGTPVRARLEKSLGNFQLLEKIEDYIRFDYGYNQYPGIFEIGTTRDQNAHVIFIQRPGTYVVQYRICFNTFVEKHTRAEVVTQLFEPDWDGFTGYVTWHNYTNWNNELHHSITLIVPDDVLDMWPGNFPPIGITPPGMPMYITAWMDEQGDVDAMDIGEAGASVSDYQGSFLEVIRMGPADMADISDGRASSGAIYVPPPDDYTPSISGHGALATSSLEGMPSRPLPGEKRASQIASILDGTWEPRPL